ncbi:MAG: DegT/DnrJ/EryC1/StrS family aminotransferase [Actinomycetota bacterium]
METGRRGRSQPRLITQPPLPPGVYLHRPRRDLPWPLGEAGTRLLSRARHGIWQGLKALSVGADDEILVPAWQHGSEIEAIQRAGCKPLLYDVGRDDAEPDPDDLERCITGRTRALYLIHYLGWPRNPARWRRWCDERDLLLIEDCAQAFLASDEGRPLGSFGSMSIYCMYKTVGIPDGAALHCVRPVSLDQRKSGSGMRLTVRAHAEWLMQSRNLVKQMRGARKDAVSDVGGDFDLGDPHEPPTWVGRRLLPRLLSRPVAERRRRNFLHMSERLADMTPVAWRTLPEGASPMVYPVEVDDKRVFLRRLGEEGISGLNLWSVPHPEIAAANLPVTEWFRAHIVGLPVHQELRRSHLDHIAAAASSAAS